MQPNDHEWKREVHSYIDEQIEKHNTANQREFERLRDGQLALQSDISSLETKVTADISSLETKVTADISSLETKVTADISSLETKVTADISSLETKVTADISSLETTLTSEIRSVLAASAEAHQEIIARLERLENGKTSSE